jgi:hypothetical protein
MIPIDDTFMRSYFDEPMQQGVLVDLSGGDMVFVLIARKHGVPLVTSDAKMTRKARGVGVTVYSIGEYLAQLPPAAAEVPAPGQPVATLTAARSSARAKGWDGPVKVSARLPDCLMLEYVEAGADSWQLHGPLDPERRQWRKDFSGLDDLESYLRGLGATKMRVAPRVPMLAATGTREGWRLEIVEFAQAAKLIGEDTFAAFMRCFVVPTG